MSYDPDTYDAAARRERYLRDRQLKGRNKSKVKSRVGKSGGVVAPKPQKKSNPAEAKARVNRLQSKVNTLENALTKALVALSEKRRSAEKTEKKNSDGKTTVEERQASKEYRDKNKQKLAEKRDGSKGSSDSKKSSSESSVEDLQARVTKIRSTLNKAKKQLAEAKSATRLSHSTNSATMFAHAASIIRKESVLMTDADFGGWATRHDVQCSDGRTILPGAFEDQDGVTVPLVYQHGHTSNEDVLGHCLLEYRPEGVYAHAYFNKTPKAQMAKEQVQHGDLTYLSIFANNLREKARAGVQHAKDVMKGEIREVSLVLAGANPGAFIDNVTIAHSDGAVEYGDEAVISMGMELDLNDISHAESESDEDETLEDIIKTLTPKQETAFNFLLSQALSHDGLSEEIESVFSHSVDDGGDSIEDVLATLSPKQGTALNFLLSQALAHSDTLDEGVDDSEKDGVDDAASTGTGDEGKEEHNNEADVVGDDDTNNDGDTDTDNNQEDTSMSHNIFDKSGATAGTRPSASLQHGQTSMEDALRAIVKDAKRNGSLKDALENYITHTGIMVGDTLQHGVENLDYLFPDAQTIENHPAWISRRMEWVDKVLSGVRKSPFSRIKTITADITPDEARARGYIKGNFKNEEFFALSKRVTDPQTIYKKQRLDRDDVIDITTLDVIAWLKAEMKVMLDEELAAAILVGDGRSIGDEDKILENHIRPIASDSELYVTTVRVNIDDADSTVEELVDAVIQNRRYYKGSGTPTFFTTESVISAFLTVKDNFGRRLYTNLNEVAAVLRVSEVVPVEVMERVEDLVGIMVNLSDYTLGADRGGQATMFDDFDIDYNKLIYLIETRCSGALTQPKAAIVFRKVDAAAQLVEPEEPTFENNVVTVPTKLGVTYKNADTNATLTTASPVTVAYGSALNVIAVPSNGYYFGNSETDQWTFANHDIPM